MAGFFVDQWRPSNSFNASLQCEIGSIIMFCKNLSQLGIGRESSPVLKDTGSSKFI